MQYILGSAQFFGLPFSVAPGVLIPRPETETLVQEVIRLAGTVQTNELRIADIGTGSGAIAVALAHALPLAKIDAVDLSHEALHIARKNAERNQVIGQIHFHHGDLLAPLSGEHFHIIASNPPYIPSLDHDSLSVEIHGNTSRTPRSLPARTAWPYTAVSFQRHTSISFPADGW